MVPADIRRRFDAIAGPFAVMQGRVRDVVLYFCEGTGYAYVGRAKSLESIAEKVETGRVAAWSELDDLFGCTIVVPSRRHEKDVLTYLQKEFQEHATKLKGQTKQDPEIFRFGATRFIGTLRPGPVGLAEENDVSRLRFEIQIRTAFEHAWSVATHDQSATVHSFASRGKPSRVYRLAWRVRSALVFMSFIQKSPQLVCRNRRTASSRFRLSL